MQKLESAKNKEYAKRAETETAENRLESFEKELSEFTQSDTTYRAAVDREKLAAKELQTAEARMSESKGIYEVANDRAKSTNDTLRRVMASVAAADAAEQRQSLIERIEKAEELRQRIQQAMAEIKVALSQSDIENLENLDGEMRLLRRTRNVEAVSVTMAYTTGRSSGIYHNGKPLRDGQRTSIPDGARLDIDGLGQLTVHPGRAMQDDALARAEAELNRALTKADAISMDDARSSAKRGRNAEERCRESTAELSGIAPNGIDALRQQIAALPEQQSDGGNLPTVEEAREAADTAQQALADASVELAAVGEAQARAREVAAAAIATVEAAGAQLGKAKQALSGIDDWEAERNRRKEALAGLRAELSEATRLRERVAEASPNLEAATTALERARSVVQNAENDRQRIHVELVKLNTSIEIQANSAVEEELADVEARLKTEQRALEDLRFEVAVLQKLDSILDTVRASARDRYVQPVLKELEPLLRLFWPKAELHIDASTVLPTALVREESPEDFQILSGGTREQIALLVRLAFARMLAKTGAAAPVILDDAIVYTDDDRIEIMFDALTGQARDLQIIVFSCRQKVFRDLGGHSLNIAPASPA